jgi:hypothetical protein
MINKYWIMQRKNVILDKHELFCREEEKISDKQKMDNVERM